MSTLPGSAQNESNHSLDRELQAGVLAGVSPDLATPAGGVKALMVAATRGSREVCDALIDVGADINRVMGSGEPFFALPNGVDFDMPALRYAVDGKRWDLAGHLLARGATPSFGVMQTDIALTLVKFAPVSLVEQMYQGIFDRHGSRIPDAVR